MTKKLQLQFKNLQLHFANNNETVVEIAFAVLQETVNSKMYF